MAAICVMLSPAGQELEEIRGAPRKSGTRRRKADSGLPRGRSGGELIRLQWLEASLAVTYILLGVLVDEVERGGWLLSR